MRDGGFGDEFGDLCQGADEVTPKTLHVDQNPSALPRVEVVSDGVGKIASFRCDRFHREKVAHHECPVGLSAENLTEPPGVAQCAGHTDRLFEVRPCQFGIMGGDAGTRGECSSQ